MSSSRSCNGEGGCESESGNDDGGCLIENGMGRWEADGEGP